MADGGIERLPSMLRADGAERDVAYQELRDLLVRAALAHLLRQHYPLEAFGTDSVESLAEDFAQESLAIILTQLDSFRGESRFTTWAYRIVVNLVSDEFRRRGWRRRSLDHAPPDGGARVQFAFAPDLLAERKELVDVVVRVIEHELTPRQRQALVGRIFEEKPLIVLAEELDTSKDNVYKLIHDARKRLRRELVKRGFGDEDLFAAIESA